MTVFPSPQKDFLRGFKREFLRIFLRMSEMLGTAAILAIHAIHFTYVAELDLLYMLYGKNTVQLSVGRGHCEVDNCGGGAADSGDRGESYTGGCGGADGSGGDGSTSSRRKSSRVTRGSSGAGSGAG